jgi:hypothetical protein
MILLVLLVIITLMLPSAQSLSNNNNWKRALSNSSPDSGSKIAVPKKNIFAIPEALSKIIPSSILPSSITQEEEDELLANNNKQRGELVLQRLNLTSNTEPRTFSIEPSAFLNILSASIPVRGGGS